MKKVMFALSLLATSALFSAPARASAQIDAYKEKLQAEYDESTASLNKALDLDSAKAVKGGYVWSTFPDAAYSDGGGYGFTTYMRTACTSGVDATRDLAVSGATFKNAVAAKIKRIDCRYAKDGYKVELSGTTLTVSVNEESTGAVVADKVDTFLRAKM